jgi:primosomal protein N' (replication factor Y) (superfamily II helicase)
MSDAPLYARVILPLAVEGTYTYQIPDPERNRVQPGSRVLVPFGKKRIYTAIVHSLADTPPEGIKTRDVMEVLDQSPPVNQHQLQLWDWMSSYYMCTPGEVLRAALPSGMRPESESRIRTNSDWSDSGELDPHERLLFEVVKDQGELTLGDLEMAGVGRSPVAVLKRLVEKGAVEINEFVRSTITPRHVSYIRISPGYRSEGDLHHALDGLGKAPRQLQLLERFLDMSGNRDPEEGVIKKDLLSETGDSGALAALIKKGMLEQVEREELGRYRQEEEREGEPFMLNLEQSAVLAEIRSQFTKRQAVLLQGVASSGKTEIYIHLIKEMLLEGKQVLYMLPEISLTTQIIERLRRVFGRRVGIYHSRYSDSERVHVYRNLLGLTDEEPYSVIIGVRSAIFLPFSNLGMVVVDEEHESSFKQQDPAPRYHARDAAQVLALYHNARVLMGTATPSYESLFNARTGKFGYARMESRFGESVRPEILLANTREATRKNRWSPISLPSWSKAYRKRSARVSR